MNERQKKFLKNIIDIYIETGEPVSSKTFLLETKLNYSPATIRNEMNALENQGFLEKTHTSSGRVPTIQGYNYYAKHLSNDMSQKLEDRLHEVFSKRRLSIGFTIDEAAKVITDMAAITLVASNYQVNESMKSIHLTPINEKMATIVIVTSTGRVESKIIGLNSQTNLHDVRISVRLFKERLLNTKLKDLATKVELLAPILSKSVKNYEMIIQAFIKKVFDFHNRIINKVYGSKNIIKSNIKRDDLVKLLDLIENKSIFSTIEGQLDEEHNMKIQIKSNNTSIISSKIKNNKEITEISIVGSNRMNYANAKQTMHLIQEFLEGKQ